MKTVNTIPQLCTIQFTTIPTTKLWPYFLPTQKKPIFAFLPFVRRFMKILYLIDQLYLHGGVEKMLAQKINYFIQVFGYEVILVTFEQQDKPFVYKVNERVQYYDLGINYNRSESYFGRKNVLKSFSHFNKLKNILSENKPDVIISVAFTPDHYFLPFISGKTPILKERHFSGFIIKNQTGLLCPKNLMNIFFKKYSRVIVLNKDEKKYYSSFITEVIPNFIVVSDNNRKRENTIIAAGRIAKVKQFDHLIKAWALIASNHETWKLKIFGDGDDDIEKYLQTLIKDLGLEKSVQIKQSTPLIAEEMAKAKIYALTSETECFPMVLLEAQASGLAIVSYDCPHGPRNIVENEVSGFLTENQNIVNFGAALSKIINDPDQLKKVSHNAKINSQNFTDSIIMEQWDKLLRNLIYERKN